MVNDASILQISHDAWRAARGLKPKHHTVDEICRWLRCVALAKGWPTSSLNRKTAEIIVYEKRPH